MIDLKIALDWTPNTNHTGFFVAQELGYYADNNLEISILNPDTDDYTITPAKKLELGLVDFAVAPFESVISLNTKAARVNAVAIAALLQEDISSIVTLAASNITRPRDLDNRTYASYKARYEDAIVRQLIINDGGAGTVQVTYPEKLGIWETLLTGKADSTWIFDNWEGIEAETNQVKLNKFALSDYSIPYGYSPVIIATKEAINEHAAAYRAFLAATKKGFQFAKNAPQQAVVILSKHLPERDARTIDVLKSQEFVAPYYGDETAWGKMNADRVTAFLHWLIQNKLETAAITTCELYTNDLLS